MRWYAVRDRYSVRSAGFGVIHAHPGVVLTSTTDKVTWIFVLGLGYRLPEYLADALDTLQPSRKTFGE